MPSSFSTGPGTSNLCIIHYCRQVPSTQQAHTHLSNKGSGKDPMKPCSLVRSRLTNSNRWHIAGKSKGKGNGERGTSSDGEKSEALKVKWHLGRALKDT